MIIKGFIFYLLILLISILTGRGILRLLGIRPEPHISLYLAPSVTLVFWTILLGVGITLHFTVKQISLLGWTLTVCLMSIGVWRQGFQFLKNERIFLCALILLPVSLMAPFFWHGLSIYLGSLAPDGWACIANAQYLWEYPRGTEGGLAPLYQFAAHLNRTRFIESALHGFLSPLLGSPGDPQTASGLFLAWVFFTFSSTCMFFAAVKRWGKKSSLFYVTLCGFSGWSLNLLWANNFANALVISYLPAFAGLILLADPKKWRWGILLAGLTAGVLYSYPEMALFILAGSFFLFLSRLYSEKEVRREWGILFLIIVGLGGILIAPFGKDMVWFIVNQLHTVTGTQVVRPGEGFFRELLSPKFGLGGFWGFGGDYSAAANLVGSSWSYLGKTWDLGRNVLGITFSLLALLGILLLFKRKEWEMIGLLALFLLGSLFMIFHLAYSYGAYKFIVLNWWGMSLIVVLGIQFFSAKMPKKRREIEILSVCLILAFLSTNGIRVAAFNFAFTKTILPFKQLEEIKKIVRNEPIIVVVEDDLANQWAVYFLRDLPVYLAEYKVYMAQPHVIPYMDRAKPVKTSQTSYILADSIGLFSFSRGEAFWSGGPYYLWKVPRENWIFISSLRNENGREIWGGECGFWIGKGDTEIKLLSPKEGEAILQGFFILGPSLPDKKDRRLLIQSDQGYQKVLTIWKEGPQTLRIPISTGPNHIILRALDKPTLSALPSGDNRPMLVGIRGLKVSWGGNHYSAPGEGTDTRD